MLIPAGVSFEERNFTCINLLFENSLATLDFLKSLSNIILYLIPFLILLLLKLLKKAFQVSGFYVATFAER
jgi:hypothetical protein